LEKLLEIAFHFEAKNHFFNKMDYFKILNKNYKNKIKNDFLVEEIDFFFKNILSKRAQFIGHCYFSYTKG